MWTIRGRSYRRRGHHDHRPDHPRRPARPDRHLHDSGITLWIAATTLAQYIRENSDYFS
jgi:hypothetical protein